MVGSPPASPGRAKLRRKVSVENPPGETASQRLVEYFVVVSSIPRWESHRVLPEPQRRNRKKKFRRKKKVQEANNNVDPTSCSPEKEPGSTEGNIHLPQEHAEHTFQPKITARYPAVDHEDHALNPMIVQFCYPHSDVICTCTEYVMPRIHHFVLTNDKGRKVYGTCLTVYEEYHPTDDAPIQRNKVHTDAGENNIEVTPDGQASALYIPKVLCVLSTWPYLTAFREYLTQLYRLATTTDLMTTPIERHVMNFCREIPAPPPGAFEIQVSILTSTIRFWAPPAKLPIAYVALPYQTLFDCLDLDNVLQVWYALTLERKVLLLSSQYSILSVCAEILCSLLFPLQWSHLYIPLLPQFLSPMLDAPVPYLVGVIRDNWWLAQQHVNEETIVVDLDRNQVTLGEGTEPLPPSPTKKWLKLKASLEQAVGSVYWKTRGVEKEHRQLVHKKLNLKEWNKVRAQGDARWNEQLRNFDEAIHLAYAPESPNLLNDVSDEGHQSQWDRAQEAFLRFFVSVFRDYRKFLNTEDLNTPESSYSRWSNQQLFDRDAFLASQKVEYKPFLAELCLTQQFDDFVTKRLYSPGEPDVIFFDQSIDAKLNRSKLKIRKLDTAFLQSAQAHKVLKVEHAVAPNSEGLSRREPYVYEDWPDTFDPTLFCTPRPIPRMITAEFDRQSALVMRLRANRVGEDEVRDNGDLYLGHYDSSPEVATFTVFFITYSAVIGRDWQKYVEKLVAMEEMGYLTSEDDAEYQEALAVAAAQLDLAFEVLSMLQMRGLSLDPEAIKSLMEACGRCGDAERATQLLEIIKRDGLVADSEIYSSFLSAFSYGEGTGIESPGTIEFQRRGSDAYSTFLKRKWAASRPVDESFLHSSNSGGPASVNSDEWTSISDSGTDVSSVAAPAENSSGIFADCYHMITLALEGWKATPVKKPRKKKKPRRHRRKKSAFAGLLVNDKVQKQVALGENLLDFLYPDLSIDTKSDACPQCSRVLSETEIVAGWRPRQFSDFTTACPDCGHRFVPRFVVKCSDPSFEGSQGISTPLYCEFLSPWVLIKELKQDIHSLDMVEKMLSPEWRSGTDINATLWWNLAVSFIRYKLPVSFLLQGSFQNRLINPDPEAA